MRILDHIYHSTRRKALLFLLAGCAAGAGAPAYCASTYFVDAHAGNDTWSGQQTQPTGSDGPWRTLRRVAATPLQPGDTLILKCGGTWREPLLIRGAGSREATVSIRAEPACDESARPEINLAESLGTWVTEGGQVHSTEVDFQVKQVFVNGQFLEQARYPASGFLIAENGLPLPNPGGGSTGVVDSRLQIIAGRDAAGAQAYVRTVGWLIESLEVASLAGSQIRFSGSTRYPVRKGAGYYLSGKRWMLTAGPGWYWNPGEKRLYVRLPDGASPAAHQVDVVRHDYGMRLVNQPYVHVSGIRVRYAALDGMRVERSAQTILTDMEIVASGRDGVAFTTESNGAIQDSLIRESGRDGISLWQSHGVKVMGNRVENSGMTGGPRNSLAAINATNSNYVHIERNTVSGAGYIGIRFNRNSRVVNNVVRNVCLVLDDCGAIYSWANIDPRPLNSVVIGNLIENVVGNRTGSPDSWTLAAGIYLDDLTNGVTVEGNTVSKAERGIYLHNAFDNVIQGNTVMDGGAYSLILGVDHKTYPTTGLRANTIHANILVSMQRASFVYYLDRVGSDFNDVLDANAYLGPAAEKGFVVHRQGLHGDVVDAYSDSAFRKLPGKSAHGSFSRVARPPVLLMNDAATAREYACPLSPSSTCGRATDPVGEQIIWPVRLPPYGSLVVVNG